MEQKIVDVPALRAAIAKACERADRNMEEEEPLEGSIGVHVAGRGPVWRHVQTWETVFRAETGLTRWTCEMAHSVLRMTDPNA